MKSVFRHDIIFHTMNINNHSVQEDTLGQVHQFHDSQNTSTFHL